MRDWIRAYCALAEVARTEGIPIQTVVQKVDEAIAAAIEKIRGENNEELLAIWAQIPCEGEIPNAFEFVAYMGNQLRMEQLRFKDPLTGNGTVS